VLRVGPLRSPEFTQVTGPGLGANCIPRVMLLQFLSRLLDVGNGRKLGVLESYGGATL